MSAYRSVSAFGILSSRSTRIAKETKKIGVGIDIRTLHCKSSRLYVNRIAKPYTPLPLFLNQQGEDFVDGWQWFHQQDLTLI